LGHSSPWIQSLPVSCGQRSQPAPIARATERRRPEGRAGLTGAGGLEGFGVLGFGTSPQAGELEEERPGASEPE